ncbi:MAG TPA: hypothetical protein VJA94_23740 [Candidatus Angelobacter sp.]
MPDPKPPAAAPEPITLRDLIELFASTVVSTSQQLDQASVDLRNLYLNSGNAALATLVPPRYILDQISIDLSFIVVQAKPEVSGNKLPDAHKLVLKDPVAIEDPEFLHSKLADVAKSDAVPGAKARSSQIQAQIEAHKRELAAAEANLKSAAAQAEKIGREATSGPPQQRIAAVARLQAAQGALGAAHGRFNEANARLNPQISALTALRKQYDDAIALLSGKDPLTEQKLADLQRIGVPVARLGTMWDNFYQKYLSLKSGYDSSVKAFQEQSGFPKLPDFQLSDADQQILDKIQAISGDPGEKRDWNKVKKSAAAIRDDYVKTLDALNALVRLVADIKGSGLQVRVDPKALTEVPPEARQKLHLTFHGQTQEKVKIGEKDVDVT